MVRHLLVAIAFLMLLGVPNALAVRTHTRIRGDTARTHVKRVHQELYTRHEATTAPTEAPFVQHVPTRFVTPNAKGATATGWIHLPTTTVITSTVARQEAGADQVWFIGQSDSDPPTLYTINTANAIIPATFPSLSLAAPTWSNLTYMTSFPVAGDGRVTLAIVTVDPLTPTNSTVWLLQCAPIGTCTNPYGGNLVVGGQVTALTTDDRQILFIGTTSGVVAQDVASAPAPIATKITSDRVLSLAYQVAGSGGNLAVGTSAALYIASFNSVGTQQGTPMHYWTQQLIDGNVTAVAWDPAGSLWVGNPYCINILNTNGQWQRVGGREGLPYGNITSIAAGFSIGAAPLVTYTEVWIGTSMGSILARVDLANSSPEWTIIANFSYYSGPRWHPGVTVFDVAPGKRVGADGTVIPAMWLRTETGFSVIERQHWTWSQKAAHYEAIVQARHVRFGMVSNSNLKVYGDLSSNELIDSDNDGSWTSYYGVAEALRVLVTDDPEAHKLLVRTFEAMEFLNNVTGVPGFVARSVLKEGVPPVSGNPWFNSTVYPGWKYKGNTSSDEISCHWWLYPLVMQATNDPNIKDRAARLTTDITSYIMNNSYNLQSPNTGKPTRWGVWNPDSLNNDPYWSDERGLNSLEMIGGLLSAIAGKNESKYHDGLTYLEGQNYLRNLLNTKITAYDNIDHSDDHLAFVSYMTILFLNPPARILDPVKTALHRSWADIRQEHGTFFNWVYHWAGGTLSPSDLVGSLNVLKQWPLETVDWPFVNSHRIDVIQNPEPAIRSANTVNEGMKVFPPDEGDWFRWSHNPYHLDSGSGTREYDPSAWLMAYWLGRYLGIIGPDA